MRHVQPDEKNKVRELYREWKLLKHVRVLYICHVCCILFTLLLDIHAKCLIDLIKNIISVDPKVEILFESFFYHETINSWIHKFYDLILSSETTSMVELLLAIWTFVTAVIIFYLGKKDELLYGISNWNIVENYLNKIDKFFILFVLFFDLALVLMSLIIKISISLFCLGFWLVVISLYVFLFVLKCTDMDNVSKHLKLIIQIRYVRRTDKKDLDDYLLQILRNIDYEKEDDLDFLLDLIEKLFGKVNISFENSYRIAISIYIRITNQEARILFIKNIIKAICQFQDKKNEYLSAVLMPIFEYEKGNLVGMLNNIISGIPDEKERRRILVRSIVYNGYLDVKSKSRDRVIICEQLRRQLINISEDEISDAKEFYWNLFEENGLRNINMNYITYLLR